jgi:hypothetical protein
MQPKTVVWANSSKYTLMTLCANKLLSGQDKVELSVHFCVRERQITAVTEKGGADISPTIEWGG